MSGSSSSSRNKSSLIGAAPPTTGTATAFATTSSSSSSSERSATSSSSAASSSSWNRLGSYLNKARPLSIPKPARAPLSFFFFAAALIFASNAASFLAALPAFQAMNTPSVTGVHLVKSNFRRSSSIDSMSDMASSPFSFCSLGSFRTNPGGRACLYRHASAPFGHFQNQPYFFFSIASKKYLQTIFVSFGRFLCFSATTDSNLA
mmetsp:Transcript_4262/g.4915  ORF Transcript_4262/g.4915 Transcript_4262/m.4915 type:complete len:205 (-) Transcript_4262:364-978(-)